MRLDPPAASRRGGRLDEHHTFGSRLILSRLGWVRQNSTLLSADC